MADETRALDIYTAATKLAIKTDQVVASTADYYVTLRQLGELCRSVSKEGQTAPPPTKGPRWSTAPLPHRGITIPCNGGETCPHHGAPGNANLHYHEPAEEQTGQAQEAPKGHAK